jgi:hypothetical protein
VRLHEDGDQLSVEVCDDGRGFDVATASRGNGLTNMEDRLDAPGRHPAHRLQPWERHHPAGDDSRPIRQGDRLNPPPVPRIQKRALVTKLYAMVAEDRATWCALCSHRWASNIAVSAPKYCLCHQIKGTSRLWVAA